MTRPLQASYVLPLRWTDTRRSGELTEYLRHLSAHCEVLVVDGSPPDVFNLHAQLWARFVRHVPPDPDLTYLNGKVNGVTTGIRAARHERVVIADDDVRYDAEALQRTVDLLDDADLVFVQTYFDPAPWHARWDTARTLLNRAFGIHFPVTAGLRRSVFLAIGGYDGDVLFENLELVRSMAFGGARPARPQDLLVRHLPPDRRWFWSQRVRQAYDDFTIPARMALWLCVVPGSLMSLRRSGRGVVTWVLTAVVVAEVGRRRGGAAARFPRSAPLFAPLWVLERGVCAWVAVWQRLARGGVTYHGRRVRRSATPVRRLRMEVARRLERHRREP